MVDAAPELVADLGEDRSLAARVRASEIARDVVLVSVIALALGVIRLGAPSFWVDEAFTARAVDRSFPDLLDRQYHLLYYTLLKPWTFLTGTSEWALRLPSVLGTALACGLLVVLARRLFDRRVAVLAGVLLAASPFIVKWSQQARSYSMLLAVSLLATLLLLRALERGSRGAWALYGLAYSAVVVWHPVSGFLLAPAHLVLVAQRRDRVAPHGLLSAVVVAAVAVPWAAVVAMRSAGEGVAMNWLKFPTAEVAVRALLDVSGAAGLGVALAVPGLWLLRRAGRADVAWWLGTWALSPFLLSLVVSIARPIYLDRYLIVAAPAFALLAGVTIAGLGRRLGAGLGLLAVAASIAGLVLWYSPAENGNWRGEDWRSAVETVLERRAESDAIVVAPWSAAPAASYYGVRVADVSAADSIWVLTWSETGDRIARSERNALGFGDHRLVERLQFGSRVTAELWRRPLSG
jgi:mannosyltransferase